MSEGLHGSCLCGDVRYVITGPLRGVLNCHCSMCRKAHGAAFRTRATLARIDFHWLAGEEMVCRYESSPGTFRTFCGRCGSNLVSEFAAHPNWLGFGLGTLDDDPGVRAELHVHVASKAPWYEIADNLPQYEELPPGA